MLQSICREMQRNKRKVTSAVISLGMIASVVTPVTISAKEDEDVVKLRVMETTDIHSHVMNYDYFSGEEANDFGLVNTATLIRDAKEEAKNSLLFDNGDLIQGSPLADYLATEKEWSEEDIHTVYQAMNLLDYDAGNYGNHEFNYGLEYLNKVTEGSNFPYVNANVYKVDEDDDPSNDENYFDPYVMLDKKVVDEDGEEHTLKVGVIGFTPPQITQWDKNKLEGKVKTKGIVNTAEKFVPQMKEEGADIVVAIAHSGIGDVTQSGMEENATYDLSKVDGIDAIMFGHAHQQFPGKAYADLEGVDVDKGTINGTPSVMPGFWGSHLGMIDFTVEKVDGDWTVQNAQSKLKAIYDSEKGEALVEPDEEIVSEVKEDHEATIDYVNSAVGETESPLYSYFSQVQDDPTVQIVTDAQKAYVKEYIQGTELEGLPVLSAGAPFKAGRDGVTDYTDIAEGDLAIKDTTSLYKYPNTVNVLKLTGSEVREWLEWSAGQFNKIDPNSKEEQLLVKENNRSDNGFPSYNFDVIDGVSYQIDVTEPQRYNKGGTEVINDTHRIKNLKYNGEPIDEDQQFLIATNNYRASATPIANPGGDNIVIESPDENRQVLVDYIRNHESVNPKADGNWSFAPIKGNPDLVFYSSPEAKKYAETNEDISFDEKLDNGFAKYNIELNKGKSNNKKDEENKEDKDEEKSNGNNDHKDSQGDSTANDMVYTIKSGDTLGKIGAKYGVFWRELANYNNISNVREIMPGQEILIPVSDDTDDYKVHRVQKGETLGKISSQYNVHWKDLARYNELDNPHRLYVGQEIKIPKKSE
ncbi:bifunctional 2',3'-cyclic-nucleotide 2'-phosphodiesterase/3'-nucleotidase [Pontibacillus yanchengensis]|uniref:Bifunctional 2',3'-cyclic-nucleotide 2'-phosphodiesterase/3'-nucleotidase n=2 Tax=Pontibacillus yanchengensis TaxID=462910 RepID=A0A6I4ZQ81_9BACI|nr:bifunctional 2',3'-cyclic-nucleotide 2'-phosphodiesterase/3'-nucleotidase [Pontibacillus yanchengensis]MYL32405.1 bifunctional 2',3'-cyclic-nucleotide 2'-phosphodiesterase/3'-nucleotidase [Pontibacillus yanchengensis]MYL52986.1 bifunctional 2',3'-cyclic-nucleotide 2'-phosphodiesterase/3'-nucleotidase [Pontibacillus yanchengensis]